MTYEEFDERFSRIQNHLTANIYCKELVRDRLAEYADEDGKISIDSAVTFSVCESVNYCNQMIRSCLLEFLGFEGPAS